jgi:uncharacterized membrane protein
MSGEAGCFLATVLLVVGFFASVYMLLLGAL